MTLGDDIQIVGVAAQFVTSIAAICVACIAYYASRRAYVAQSTAAMLAMINDFNALALTNDDCLRTFNKLLLNSETADLAEGRRLWAAFSYLNNRQLHFFLAKNSHTNRDYLEQDRKNLTALLGNTFIAELLDTGGYDPAFIKYCKDAMSAAQKSS